MPMVFVDSEAADLVEAAVQMLEAALKARVKRADPNEIISNSLILQSHKLESFRAQLRSAPPPPLSGMAPPLRKKALTAAKALVAADDNDSMDHHWRTLTGLVHASQGPSA